MSSRVLSRAVVGVLALALTGVGAPVALAQPVLAKSPDDGFYSYDGAAPLSSYAPGAVLETRTVPYTVLNIPTPIQAVQVLYRSTDAWDSRPPTSPRSCARPTPNRTKLFRTSPFTIR